MPKRSALRLCWHCTKVGLCFLTEILDASTYMCHSIRKPFLGALYGIYVGKGVIDIDETLEELNIDDIPPSLIDAE